MFFSPYLGIGRTGGGGGAPKGLVHNLLMQFFTLGSSKFSKLVFLILSPLKMTIQGM